MKKVVLLQKYKNLSVFEVKTLAVLGLF